MSQPALIYTRVSSERQKTEGHGLESQEHRCRQFAAQYDYEVEQVFRDSFSGGGDFMRRPQMVELLKYLDAHHDKQYVIIFDDLKRFARDTIFHLKLRAALEARRAIPKCLNFDFDDSPTGRFVETIMAASGQLEREQNKLQVLQKTRARLEKGYWPFFPPPGYKYTRDPLHGKLLVPDNPDAEIIREALEGYVSDRLSDQTAVMNFLKSRSFRKGKRVYNTQAKRILTQVLYAGYVELPRWKIGRIKGHHEALISLETFERIQAKLKGKGYLVTRKDYRLDFPLRGFVTCVTCGGSLTASWTKGKTRKYPYYWCRNRDCAMRSKSIKKEDIEREFKELLERYTPKIAILKLAWVVLIDVWKKRVQELDKYKASIDDKLRVVQQTVSNFSERAAQAREKTLIAVYEENLIKAKKEEMLLLDQISKLSVRTGDFEVALGAMFAVLKNPVETWQSDDVDQKRSVLRLIFSGKLAYHPESGFQTPELSCILGLFEQITAKKSQDVEARGVEPRSENVFESVSTTHSRR